MELSKQQGLNGATVVEHLQKDQKSTQVNSIVDKYIENRKEKNEEQLLQEDELAHAKQTRSNWDELISYRYAIF